MGDTKISLKWGGHKKWGMGNFWKGKYHFVKIDEKNSFIKQKQYQYFPNSEKIILHLIYQYTLLEVQ